MIQKITLTYENGEYTIGLENAVLAVEQDEDKAIEAFRNAVKNNTGVKVLSFTEMMERIKSLGYDKVTINDTYQTMQLDDMKYFYHTGKVFYTGEGKMVLLAGGFDFFYQVVLLAAKGQIASGNDIVSLCAQIVEHYGTYSLTDDGLSVSSAVFSYGNVGFNFTNSKLNKGTSSEKADFEAFKTLVVNAL